MATPPGTDDPARLHAIKLLHTVAWVFFASCTVAIPVLALRSERRAAALLIGVVWVEVLILAVNRWRCPLTPIAARYTTDRRDNFDIYLPEWLARHNTTIFGALLAVGMLLTALGRW
ncbi:MAG: hypothetical protein MUC69_05285 [Gemmatimonadales bacterium]|jgi:hypothetical protein|nr:hypothetical protein [Gemmatimonadales bacterium]